VERHNIAIVGLGWSGSGALIDLFEKAGNVDRYPYELDFWRKPGGLWACKNEPEFRKVAIREICITVKVMIKNLIKCLIYPSYIKGQLRAIASSAKLAFSLFIALTQSINPFNNQPGLKTFLMIFRRLFGSKNSVFVYDQPLFVEQISDESLSLLEAPACIFVVRDVFDQVQDLINNAQLLNVSSIRESFFIGAMGDLELGSESQQLRLMLNTLRSRVTNLKRLINQYPTMLLVVRFEDLILNTQQSITGVNSFLHSRGLPQAVISEEAAENIFLKSVKNIGIGSVLKNQKSPLIQEMYALQEDVEALLGLAATPANAI